MKYLSFILLLAITTPSFASSGGGADSPFIALNPPIIVNIRDGQYVRHMQVNIEIKLVDKSQAGKIMLHLGPLRHELILLLSSQDATTISRPNGKEELRKTALKSLQDVMLSLEEEPIIEALYFTNFVIQ